MAATNVEFEYATGLTLIAYLYPHGSDTVANTTAGDTATERTNMKGLYTVSVSEALSGLYNVLLTSSTGGYRGTYHVDLEDTTGTFRCGDMTIVATTGDQSLAASVWSHATRTLTQSAASVASAVSGSAITLTRGETNTASITGLGDLTGWAKLWFTAKRSKQHGDSAALVQIVATTTGSSLERLHGSSTGVVGTGTITVDNTTAGNVTITLDATASAAMESIQGGYYDIQRKGSTGNIVTETAGTYEQSLDVTRATA